MPLYRYKCQNQKCQGEHEVFRTIGTRDTTPLCHDCDSPMKRMLDIASVSFIGKGFASNE